MSRTKNERQAHLFLALAAVVPVVALLGGFLWANVSHVVLVASVVTLALVVVVTFVKHKIHQVATLA